MVEGGVDHPVAVLDAASQAVQIGDVASVGLDARRPQHDFTRIGPCQAQHLMAVLKQFLRDG